MVSSDTLGNYISRDHLTGNYIRISRDHLTNWGGLVLDRGSE